MKKSKLLIVASLVAFMAAPAAAQENETMAKIRQLCETEWPGDYRMQEFCIEQQVKGANAVMDGWNAAAEGSDIQQIYARCYQEWTEGGLPDWRMIDFCAEQQLKSYRKLNP